MSSTFTTVAITALPLPSSETHTIQPCLEKIPESTDTKVRTPLCRCLFQIVQALVQSDNLSYNLPQPSAVSAASRNCDLLEFCTLLVPGMMRLGNFL